ncbi:MAG TPA: hypothetical protein VHL09_16075 [Dehalococcoidia bacterium]|nr:hypothetical protein [Dehalococcoidia bacterium]
MKTRELGQLHEIDLTDPTDPIELVEEGYRRGWAADGLPVVLPTEERVREFVDRAGRDPGEVIGGVPERRREVTVGKAAANAVMAGCLPEYFPVVLAACEAMFTPEFNPVGPFSSMGGSAILVIVNGPIRRTIDLNCRNNIFGPGWRANATIGRAIRLIQMNSCASIPGVFDRSTLGHPGKYSYCIGEDEENSPWEPFHVDRGFDREESVVTVFAAEGPRQVRNSGSARPEGVLYAVADVLASQGTSLATSGSVASTPNGLRLGETAVVMAQEHRDVISAAGWTKADVRDYLFEHATRSLADLKRTAQLPGEIAPGDEAVPVRVVEDPRDIFLLAGGGSEGGMTAVIPAWGAKAHSVAVSRKVRG